MCTYRMPERREGEAWTEYHLQVLRSEPRLVIGDSHSSLPHPFWFIILVPYRMHRMQMIAIDVRDQTVPIFDRILHNIRPYIVIRREF